MEDFDTHTHTVHLSVLLHLLLMAPVCFRACLPLESRRGKELPVPFEGLEIFEDVVSEDMERLG